MGHLDLEASEKCIRDSMHEIGSGLLASLLNADGGGYRGAQIACGRGHRARFLGYRSKRVLTILGAVSVQRAYYYCAQCDEGLIPKDGEMDVSGTSFSPGVRRMMGRVGAGEAFEEGRKDLEELAGVSVKTKEVERVSEAIGASVESCLRLEQQAALAGKLMPMNSAPTLYIAVDGTGVPIVPRETEGRKGRDPTGQAKTREAKLGCVFTQTRVDERNRPVRDEASTSYVGAIETAEAFGYRVYTEAVRRGVGRAGRVVVLGDGAGWIWGLADMHFPGAIEIVDLYHARQHLAELAAVLYGAGQQKGRAWMWARFAELDRGEVERVVRSMKKLRPAQLNKKESIERTVEYFRHNAHRMKYAEFKRAGLFVGSGVVEAGCKAVIGQRLKQSGMRWTVRGANAIIALRCCQKSGRWEEYWEGRAAA